jgi:predicted O-methyltransferase YrrM
MAPQLSLSGRSIIGIAPALRGGARSLARDVSLALAHPSRAWGYLRSGASLARYAGLSLAEVLRYRSELRNDREFQEHLERSMRDVPYVFPGAAALYVVVRAVKPRVIVETGVASGLSSAHILRALAVNGTGVLHSIDLPNVQEGSTLPEGRTSGWIVPDSLRGRWQLRLGDTRKLLPDLLATLGQVDLFLHDSDHSYENMLFEFEQALPRLAPGGLLMSDDIDLHGAWEDFCAKHGLRPTHIGSLGVTRMPDIAPPRSAGAIPMEEGRR